jgi:hypothetical protein
MTDVKRYKTTWDRLGIASSDAAVFVPASDYDAMDAAATALGTEVQRLVAELRDINVTREAWVACVRADANADRDRLRAALERIAAKRTAQEYAEAYKGNQQMLTECIQIAREALRGATPQPEPSQMKVTEEMVTRFLGWRLPSDFSPDAGVNFTPPNNPHWWPVGTNLLTAAQARAMLEHVLGPADQTAGSQK